MSIPETVTDRIEDLTGKQLGSSNEEEEEKGRVDIDDLEGEELTNALEYLEAIGEETKRKNIEEAAYYLRNVDDNEELYSAYETGEERGRVDRSIVAPRNMERETTWHTRDGDFYQILTTTSLPRLVNPGWLVPLTLSKHDVRISMHIKPRETSSVKGRLQQRLTQMKSAIQWKKRRGRTDVYEEEHERHELERLLRNVIEGTTRLFDFAFYLEIHGETLEEMEEASRMVQRNVSEQGMDLVPIEGRQIKSQQAIAPLGTDPILNGNTVQLEALATFFNFIEPPVKMPEGVLYGFDDSKRPVIVDRFELSGHSKVVSGKVGSGKTYATKMAIYRRLLNDSDLRTIIFDPLGDDFVDFTDKLEGQVINFGGGDRINPLQLEPPSDHQKTNKLYTTKVRSVIEILKTFFSQDERTGMGAAEEGVITQCIHYAYAKQGITADPETFSNLSPTMDDVIEGVNIVANGGMQAENSPVETTTDDLADCPSRTKEVVKDPSKEHQRIAEGLQPKFESFKEGSVNNNLNGNTNIELDDRIVCFNMESFADTGEMPLIMHTMLDWAYQEARRSPMKVDVTFEEAHYLLGRSGARKLLNLFIRHARHFSAGLTLISQTPDEFLKNEEVKEIYDNCDIKQLFYQENVSDDVIDYFDFSQEEVRFLRQAARGKNSNFSECLLSTSEHGRRRLELYAGPYEQHILDEELDPWGFLRQQGITTNSTNGEKGELEESVPTSPKEHAEMVTSNNNKFSNSQDDDSSRRIEDPSDIGTETTTAKKEEAKEETEEKDDDGTRDPYQVNAGEDVKEDPQPEPGKSEAEPAKQSQQAKTGEAENEKPQTEDYNPEPREEQTQRPSPDQPDQQVGNDPIDAINKDTAGSDIDWSSVDESDSDNTGPAPDIERPEDRENNSEPTSKIGKIMSILPIIGTSGESEKEPNQKTESNKETTSNSRGDQKPKQEESGPDIIEQYLGSELVRWLLMTLPVIILIVILFTGLILYL